MQDNKYFSILHWFMTDETKRDSESANYIRALIVLGVILVSSFFACLEIVYLSNASFFTDPADRRVAVAIASLTLLCYIASLLYYRVSQSLVGPSNGYALGVLVATGLPPLITGGLMYSPNMQIIVVVPVWAFLMAGRKYGIAWTLIIMLVLSAYYIAEQMGVQFPQVIAPDLLMEIKLFTWFVSIILVVTCMYVYEVNFTAMAERLHNERSKFAYEALHDGLTGLSNRKLFNLRIQESINFCVDEGRKGAVIYIDLDDFKPINDSKGHHVGDEVLKIVAMRLGEVVRSSDSVARLGGDEFGLVLHGVRDLNVVKEICNKILLVMQEPIMVGPDTFVIGASIGVTLIPDEGTQVDTIIRLADQAMYVAKHRKNRICYSSELKDSSPMADIGERMKLKAESAVNPGSVRPAV